MYQSMYEQSKATSRGMAARIGELETELRLTKRKYATLKEKTKKVLKTRKQMSACTSLAISLAAVRDEIVEELQSAAAKVAGGGRSKKEALSQALDRISQVPIPDPELVAERRAFSEIRELILVHKKRADDAEHELKLVRLTEETNDKRALSERTTMAEGLQKQKILLEHFSKALRAAREEVNAKTLENVRLRKNLQRMLHTASRDAVHWRSSTDFVTDRNEQKCFEDELLKDWRVDVVEHDSDAAQKGKRASRKSTRRRSPSLQQAATPSHAGQNEVRPLSSPPHSQRGTNLPGHGPEADCRAAYCPPDASGRHAKGPAELSAAVFGRLRTGAQSASSHQPLPRAAPPPAPTQRDSSSGARTTTVPVTATYPQGDPNVSDSSLSSASNDLNKPSLNADLLRLEQDLADLQRSLLND
ncbi:hypothetical protein DIPPA_05706 [Diplonema papillatum]|nr:hypothetical protein DIPPA_05706 [Diplonema papillatum]